MRTVTPALASEGAGSDGAGVSPQSGQGPPTPPAGPGSTLLGVHLSPVAQGAVIAVLIALALGLLLVALVVADNLGKGPGRYLRQRWGKQQLF